MVFFLARFVRRLRGRPGLGLSTVVLALMVCIIGNAVSFYYFDKSYHENLRFGDALWYSVISITTIGYGDLSAQSAGARIGTVVFIVFLGLTTFSLFFGMLVDTCAAYLIRGQRGLSRIVAKHQVLIVNFPSETRVRHLIEEIRHERGSRTTIVIISDSIEQLPFMLDEVMFVRGSTHDPETYRKARIDDADMAIVLSRDYGDANSDALAAAAVSVIDRLKPEAFIVAECVDPRHRTLFDAVRCDAIVPGLQIAGNLLVQETQDPGISLMIEQITSNQIGLTLYSTAVTDPVDTGYIELAKRLLDESINVLGFNRDGESLTSFAGHRPQPNDRIIYVCDRRRTWSELKAMLP